MTLLLMPWPWSTMGKILDKCVLPPLWKMRKISLTGYYRLLMINLGVPVSFDVTKLDFGHPVQKYTTFTSAQIVCILQSLLSSFTCKLLILQISVMEVKHQEFCPGIDCGQGIRL